jgi:histidinol dehydrogenase
MEIKIWKQLAAEEKKRLLVRSGTDISEAAELVRPIIEDVRRRGDAALREYTRKFDSADLEGLSLRASESDFAAAEKALSPEVKSALVYAVENVVKFHEYQRPGPMSFCEIRPGIFAGEKASPVPSAGLYVPRGRGSFPSMLYMIAVPAVVAGVKKIQVVTPPNPDGSIDAACLFAAKIIGLSSVFRVGGAQAIAALAYGTESVPPVCKIVGPGSRYVAAAKQLLSGLVDTGLPAGPSESIILADGSADPHLVVLDLLIEAEHGSDSSALLVTGDRILAEKAAALLPKIIAGIPEPRRTYARDVFSGYGGIILTDSFEEAAEVVNDFAPEHLQIQARDPFHALSLIRNAGEILLGPSTPFSLANYAAGANAVLPTGGKAKSYSAVSVRDFIKYSSVVQVGSGGFDAMRGHVIALAEYEGFPAHAEALKQRDSDGGFFPS